MNTFNRVFCDIDGVLLDTNDIVCEAYRVAIIEVLSVPISMRDARQLVIGNRWEDIALMLENPDGGWNLENDAVELIKTVKDRTFWQMFTRLAPGKISPIVNWSLYGDLMEGERKRKWELTLITAGGEDNAVKKLDTVGIYPALRPRVVASANKREASFWADYTLQDSAPWRTLVIDDDHRVLSVATGFGFTTMHMEFKGDSDDHT